MKVNFEEIYEHIGFLLYSIAFSHAQISEEEVKKLTNVLDGIGKDNQDDRLTVHLSDCTKEGVTYCLENTMTQEHAFSSFTDYFRIHTLPFSKSLREKIISLARAVFDELPSPTGQQKLESLEQLLQESL